MDINGKNREIRLHECLVSGDVTASAKIAEEYLFSVIQHLRRRYPHVDDPHLIDSAVHEAFMQYFQRPDQYNPAKSSLTSYLLMSAEGDLRNTLKGDATISAIAADDLDYNDLESGVTASDPNADVEGDILNSLSIVWPRLRDQLPDPVDREIVQAMLDQEHKTTVFASILGVENRTQKEQQIIVKRNKDRLRKKLRRVLNPSDYRENV